MISPILLLKEGILEEDWHKVKICYQTLTGETLSSIIDKSQEEEIVDVESLEIEDDEIDETEETSEDESTTPFPLLLSPLDGDEEQRNEDDESEEAQETEDSVRCRRVPVSMEKKVNKFKDKLTVAKKDIEFDKKVRTEQSISLHNQITRRKPVPKVKVKCSKCNKEKIVEDPLSIPRFRQGGSSGYVCDPCITRQRGKD